MGARTDITTFGNCLAIMTNRKQSKCSSTYEQINILWYIHTMEQNTVVKINKLELKASTQTNLMIICWKKHINNLNPQKEDSVKQQNIKLTFRNQFQRENPSYNSNKIKYIGINLVRDVENHYEETFLNTKHKNIFEQMGRCKLILGMIIQYCQDISSP